MLAIGAALGRLTLVRFSTDNDAEPPGGVRSEVNEGLVEAGSAQARVEFRRPLQKDAVDLKPVFAYKQVVRYVDQDGNDHWLQVGDAMNAIGPDVVEAVGLVMSAHEHDTQS